MMTKKMSWEKLLSNKRLGDTNRKQHDPGRDHFQQDFDRIVFSSAFRRLQDKTQVFPLSESDYVRRRLTHSLETSCVGRSLGHMVGNAIIKKYNLGDKFAPSHFGSIVASACVAHDLGNPPFGHSGEDAIKQWFQNEDGSKYIKSFEGSKKEDFINYEGNAQGFRLLTRLMHAPNEGGMKLTCATLAAFMKYPRCSCVSIKSDLNVSSKKHGFFEAERKYFEEVADEVGLISRGERDAWWCRHPLAYLVEAADDICYGIVDLEDGVRLGHLPYQDAEAALLPICDDRSLIERLGKIYRDKEKIELLRAKSINALISQVVDVFIANEDDLLSGNFLVSLVSRITYSEYFKKVIEIDRSRIYTARPVIEIEAAGFDVISGLLSAFVGAVEDVAQNGEKASKRSQKIIQLVPGQFIGVGIKPNPDTDPYTRLLKITDFVSGMTDSYAVSLYKKITGISLPVG